MVLPSNVQFLLTIAGSGSFVIAASKDWLSTRENSLLVPFQFIRVRDDHVRGIGPDRACLTRSEVGEREF